MQPPNLTDDGTEVGPIFHGSFKIGEKTRLGAGFKPLPLVIGAPPDQCRFEPSYRPPGMPPVTYLIDGVFHDFTFPDV